MHFNSYSEAMNADAYEDMREYIVIDGLAPSFFPLIRNKAWASHILAARID